MLIARLLLLMVLRLGVEEHMQKVPKPLHMVMPLTQREDRPMLLETAHMQKVVAPKRLAHMPMQKVKILRRH